MDFSQLHTYTPPQCAPENTGYTYSLRWDPSAGQLRSALGHLSNLLPVTASQLRELTRSKAETVPDKPVALIFSSFSVWIVCPLRGFPLWSIFLLFSYLLFLEITTLFKVAFYYVGFNLWGFGVSYSVNPVASVTHLHDSARVYIVLGLAKPELWLVKCSNLS